MLMVSLFAGFLDKICYCQGNLKGKQRKTNIGEEKNTVDPAKFNFVMIGKGVMGGGCVWV